MSEFFFASLPFLAIGGALTALASAVLATYRRVTAERRYLAILAESREVAELRERFDALRADGGVSARELRPIAAALEDIAQKLRREERLLVVAALRQPSASSRERYIAHLLGAG